MADNLGPRWRHLARVVKGERDTEKAARKAIAALLEYAASALRAGGYDASVLDAKAAGWTKVAAATILPQIEDVFLASFKATVAGVINPEPYAARHLAAVTNRLAGVPDGVFDTMRLQIEDGRREGEDISELATRVDALLSDTDRWNNRATTIARTEVIGANNAGAVGSAQATAELLGYSPSDVVKEWLSTSDGRTRETHLEADGQQVFMDETFSVGSADLDQPGDPSGPAEEVVSCRCTVLFHYPGDPDYPSELARGGQPRTANVPSSALEAPAEPSVEAVEESPAVSEAAPQDGAPEMSPEDRARARIAGYEGRAAEAEAAAREARSVAQAAEVESSAVQEVQAPPRVSPPPEELPVDPGPQSDQERLARSLTLDELVMETKRGSAGAKSAARAELRRRGFPGVASGRVKAALRAAGQETTMAEADNTCTCCGGTGEHVCGHECYVCDAGMTYEAQSEAGPGVEGLEIGDSIICAGHHGRTDTERPEAHAEPADTFDAGVTPDGTPVVQDPEAEQEDPAVETDPTTTASLDTLLADPRLVAAMHEAFASALATFAPGDVPVPGEAPAGGPERAQDIPADGDPFHGILWPEATLSGDGRMIESGATVWRDLPLPFMAQDAQQPGHDGAVRVGRIDTITRDDTTYAVPVIRYTGVWDTSPIAVETQRQVENKVARGVSVDGDDVTVELRDSDGQPLDPMVDDFPEDGVVIEAAVSARVAGSTLCSIPAFQQAYVANGTYDPAVKEPGWNADGTPLTSGQVPGEDVPTEQPTDPTMESVMASAWSLVAAAGPQWASSDFANPSLTEPTRLTVTDDGRVYGHLATWGTCHIGIDGICQEPPISATNYAYFATGSVATDSGRASVGQLTMETGHASMRANHRAAVAHYDNTGTAVADVAMGQDTVGIWFAGRLRPGTTPEQVYAMRAVGSVSGDWREVGGQLELVAALICNVPGFPIPVPAIAASGARPMAMVASGVVRPSIERDTVQRGSELLLSMSDVQAAVETVLATRERTVRASTAAARLRAHRATDASRRLHAQAQRAAALAAYKRKARVAAAAARLTKER